jgi:hypothetical protein
MRKALLASCSLLVVLAMGSVPVLAQSPSPAPKPAPAAPQGQVSQEELKKFAATIKKLLVINQDMENQMVQAVQKTGLSEQRFSDIHQAKKNPSAKPTPQVTPKEEQSYSQAVAQLTQIQKDAQTKMDQAVQSEGLGTERFNQIFSMVQKNPDLKQELRKLIQTP